MDLKEKIEKAIESNDFTTLYLIFEDRYNKYPVQMARYIAFRNAEEEGLISNEVTEAAKKYYGKLWNYTGD